MGIEIICPIIVVIQAILYILTVHFYHRELNSLESQNKDIIEANTRLTKLEKANFEVLTTILSCLSYDEDLEDIDVIDNSNENGLKNIIDNGEHREHDGTD